MVSKHPLFCISALFLLWSHAAVARVISLEAAYDLALSSDQNIAIAYEEAAKARLDAKLALTRMAPQVTSGLSQNQSGNNNNFNNVNINNSNLNGGNNRGFTTGGVRTARSVDLTLRQPILDFTVGPAYRAGKISEQSTLIQYQGRVRDTLLAVATAYYDVLMQQKLVAINRDSLRLAVEQKDLASARQKVGEVLQTDVLRSEVTVQRAQRTMVESENTLKLRRSILANILNLGIEAEFDVAEPATYHFAEETLTSAVERARRQREDLQVSGLNVNRLKEAKAEIKAQYYPSLSANAGMSRDYTDNAGNSMSNNNWQFSLSMSIPWFTGGARELNLKRANHEITQAELQNQQTLKDVSENVAEAYLQVRTLKQNIEGLKVEVAAAEENYRLLQNQYRAGEVKNLDVVQALTDLNISRTDLTVQSYQYELALRDLARRTAEFENDRVQQALQRHLKPAPTSK